MKKETITVRGLIERLYCAKPNFSAGVLRTDDDEPIRFKGKFCLTEGERVSITGRWGDDQKFGPQFMADTVAFDLPDSDIGLIQYLAKNPAFTGIGEATAEKIVRVAGTADALETMLGGDLEAFHAATRVPLAVLENLRDAWRKNATENRIRTYLASFGLSNGQMNKLIGQFGESIVSILKSDPYQLIELVDGYGFKRVDEIAQKFGVHKDHPGRIAAGVMHILREEENSGHTWTGGVELVDLANILLALDGLDSRARIQERAQALIADGKIIADGRSLSTPVMAEAESLIRDTFRNHAWRSAPVLGLDDREVKLLGDQLRAYEIALRHPISVISGGAGTGKTFTVARLAAAYQAAGLNVALCAPTGKAAKRVEELLEKAGVSLPAQTIHRMLGYDGQGFHRLSLSHDQVIGCDKQRGYQAIILDECFDYKQPILTEFGWQRIGNIVKHQKAIRVWSRNPQTGTLELKPVVRWLKHPAPDSLLKITAGRSNSTRCARVIRCTPDHKILTPYGYRRAGDLRIGEEVLVRGACLTPVQRAVLIGSLLGDGTLHCGPRRASPQAVLIQGDAQRSYLDFKREVFGPMAGSLQKGKSGFGGKDVWRVALNVTDEMYEVAQEMIVVDQYRCGRNRWSPTNRFLEWLDAQALAIWYLDNGSLARRINADGSVSLYASIHTQRFNLETHERLVACLNQKFRLTPKITPDSKGNWFLWFSKEETIRLLDLVLPFTPASMQYKVHAKARYEVPKERQPEVCAARVRQIEQAAPSGQFVYDIEVADHHNYIAGNIVVSNCSMTDVPLMAELLRRIDFTVTRLALVGDHNQLPPVGPGNVLRDILAHKLAPAVVLQKVHRQAGVLKENSNHVLAGKVAPSGGDNHEWWVLNGCREPGAIQTQLRDLFRDGTFKKLGFDPLRDVQIITPTHKGPLGTRDINRMLQYLLHGEVKGKFAVGDKVIQTSNDYEIDVMNGTLGFVTEIVGRDLMVSFDGDDPVRINTDKAQNLQLAYCMTAHKAQGSEFPCIVVLCHKSHFFADRNWLYTAVTRAAKCCILLGDRWGLNNTASKNRTILRRTLLSKWAAESANKSVVSVEVSA